MAIIKVDTDEIKIMSEEGGKLVLTPEADAALFQLFRLKALVDEAIESAGQMIEQQGLELNPAFTSVQSDHMRATYRAYGAKYYLVEPTDYLKRHKMVERKVSYSINSKEVEKYLKEKGETPPGIAEVERSKKIVIKPTVGELEEGDV